jgi:uncharacterized protein YxjI
MLSLRQFVVKERVAFVKLTDIYDIFDPQTGGQVGQAMERIHPVMALLRLLVNKQLLPTKVEVRDAQERTLFSITKGMTFLRSRVGIRNADGEEFGYFKSKLFSMGGAFNVFDKSDQLIAQVKGDWKGWNFRFLTADGQPIGTVTKKWAGLGKELFTSADTYMISIEDPQATQAETLLLLAAGLAIDIVYKEKG